MKEANQIMLRGLKISIQGVVRLKPSIREIALIMECAQT